MQLSGAIPQVAVGSDGATIAFSSEEGALRVLYSAPPVTSKDSARTIFIALDQGGSEGSAVLPFEEGLEGSTVFLPFRANKFYAIPSGGPSHKTWHRTWERWQWSDRVNIADERTLKHDGNAFLAEFPLDKFSSPEKLKLVIYAKDFGTKPWGRLFGCSDPASAGGEGDQYIAHYLELDLKAAPALTVQRRSRLETSGRDRLRIYQLFVRLFSNTNETRIANGTLLENGVGKFNHIGDAALLALKQMGFNHIWLTGIVQQATGTDYSNFGHPADDPDLLKGVAGSPYAIKDYFDVCPDYAEKPAERIEEFQALVERTHRAGLKVLIDFVPNHVARSYQSDVIPGLDFGVKGRDGAGDETSRFFDPQNNFFYLKPGDGGPPLRLPNGGTTAVSSREPGRENARPSSRDGLFEPEKEIGRVTGNNIVSWTPSVNDWYETVKLNYGFDFTAASKNVREYPSAVAPEKPLPDTWKKMDQVLAYWQELGVDGFRCDMAHMVPPEFWHWVIGRARERNPAAVFIAEAYDNDPAKVPGSDPVVSRLNGGKSNVMFDLLNAGFNAVYDDPSYKALKKIYDGPGWANDIEDAVPDAFVFDNSLRYAENHDEVRLAAVKQWGGVGMKIGLPVSALLYGLSRGPVMMYNGQEVGEPGAGLEGFGGDDSRTSIFDYWSMPELAKWVNGHAYDGGKLLSEQKDLRGSYSRLLRLIAEPAFRDGATIPLNRANIENSRYGRIGNEKPSGHWLYSFLRFDELTGQRFLVAVNLHARETMKDVRIRMPEAVRKTVGLGDSSAKTRCVERLGLGKPTAQIEEGEFVISEIPPLTPLYFEMQ